MGSKTYFKVGLFVILGGVLIVIAIVLFGAGRFFKEKIIIESYFDQSVQGLEIGAPLKLQGVQVGNVSEIGFVFNKYDTDLNYVLVRAEVFPGKIGNLKSRENMKLVVKKLTEQGYSVSDIDLADDKEYIKTLVRQDIIKGMRIELASQGVTGVGFLNIVFVDPEKFPPLLVDWKPDYLYIPSKPGTITLLTKAIEEISEAISAMDFKELGKKLNEILTSLSKVNFEEMDQKLQAVLDNMEQTVATLNEATKDVRRFGLSEQAEIQSIIHDIKAVSEDIKQLIGTGKQDPAWLLFGDPPPRINPGEK